MERQEQHIGFLDHIRGLSIFAVFAFHALGAAYGREQLFWDGWVRSFVAPKSFLFLLPATFGIYGVAAFFVVSGFCIHLSFQRSSGWKEFLVRRFFRIYPTYLFALLLFAFLFPGTRLLFDSTDAIAQFFSHLFLLHNFREGWVLGINPSFWSIAVEVQLYVLYPLLVLLVGRFGWRRSLVIVGGIEIGFRSIHLLAVLFGDLTPQWAGTSPFTFWYSWSIGAIIADAYIKREKLPFSELPLWALFAAFVGSVYFKPAEIFAFLLFSLFTGAWISKRLGGVKAPSRIPAFLAEHWRIAGLYSFSIYLLNQPLLGAIKNLVIMSSSGVHISRATLFWILLAFWPVILLVSKMCYYWVELPSISLGKWVLKRIGNRSTASGAFSHVTVSLPAQSLPPAASTSQDDVLATADVPRE